MKSLDYDHLYDVAKNGDALELAVEFTPDVICEVMCELRTVTQELEQARTELKKLAPVKAMLQVVKAALDAAQQVG